MRILLLCLLSLTTSILLPAQQNADTHSGRGEEKQIVRVQDALIDAYIHRDVAILERILADDYNYIDDDGLVMNKQQILQEFKSGDDQVTSYERQDDKVRVFANVAVMTYRYQTEETYKGQNVGGDLRLTRIFAKPDGRWQMVGAQDTRVISDPVLTSASSRDELTLKKLEQDWLDAYREGNAYKMSKILADDFVGRWGMEGPRPRTSN